MINALHSVSLGAYIILVIVLCPWACDVWYIRRGFTADSPGAEIGSEVIGAGDEAAGHEEKAEHDNEEAETEDGLEYPVSLVHGGCWGHTDEEHQTLSGVQTMSILPWSMVISKGKERVINHTVYTQSNINYQHCR